MSRVPASPYFFRPLGRALVATLVAIAVFAVWFPAPLETYADPMNAPNPAKSAWFLLWIQELVSYSAFAIYVPVALALLLVALPWLPIRPVEHAAWYQPAHRPVWVGALIAAAVVAALTLVAFFLRGEDWCLALPF